MTVDLQLGRWTAEVDGHFVVFLIGAAVHDPAVVSEVSGLLVAVVEMLAELEQDPSQGLFGYEAQGPSGAVIVQYWRPFDALENYARNPDAKHGPVWCAWSRLAADDREGAGIWHETFKVAAVDSEAVYQNMPAMGRQKVGRPITVSAAKDSARARLSG